METIWRDIKNNPKSYICLFVCWVMSFLNAYFGETEIAGAYSAASFVIIAIINNKKRE